MLNRSSKELFHGVSQLLVLALDGMLVLNKPLAFSQQMPNLFHVFLIIDIYLFRNIGERIVTLTSVSR